MSHPYRDAQSTGAPCPRCRRPLDEVTVAGKRTLWRCLGCAGLWLPRAVFLDALIEPDLQADLLGLDKRRGPTDDEKPLLCPKCKKPMQRGQYGRNSGVVVDTCTPHGIWLDPSELTRIIAFVSAIVPVEVPALPLGERLTAAELHDTIFPRTSPWWDAFLSWFSRRVD
jgi:Zn-finger nucleic acid-binding protein